MGLTEFVLTDAGPGIPALSMTGSPDFRMAVCATRQVCWVEQPARGDHARAHIPAASVWLRSSGMRCCLCSRTSDSVDEADVCLSFRGAAVLSFAVSVEESHGELVR